MKKLKKLTLSKFHEMSETEMKNVSGGYSGGDYGGGYSNIGSCSADCSSTKRCWIGTRLGTCRLTMLNNKFICACFE